MPWQKIAGGGTMQGTGGVFKVGMTSGQWDTGPRSGGAFAQSDGFWALHETAVLVPPQVLGLFIAPGLDDATQAVLDWQSLPQRLAGFQGYEVYFTTDGSDPTAASPHFTLTQSAPLGDRLGTNFLGTNLTHDTEYRFRIAARDANGRLGTFSSVVTQQMGKFAATQVVVKVGGTVQVFWNARSNVAYDVIWQDAVSWSDTLSNRWQLLATVTNDFPADTGSVNRTAPQNLGGSTMRFYRVATQGGWITNATTRMATREVVVAKPLVLVPGENWTALLAPPVSNSVAAVFGTNLLPAGDTLATATKITWYASSNNAVSTNAVWLSESGHWLFSVGGEGLADDRSLPLTQGFNVEIPGTVTQRFVLTGIVPSNTSTYALGPGATGSGGETYHLRALASPRRTTLAQTGLKSKLTGGVNPSVADEIRILNNAGGLGSRSSPAFRMWLRSTDNTFVYTPGGASAEGHVFHPGDMLLIIRRNAGSATATNVLLHTPPGKNMNP